ncbi:hypothetical protein ACFC1B_07110 [Streptomyces xiamenensis]|uniref:hypothetical protein n=1 Tax=Streptomyces xiamenensis TaxID=408015 RepID=UPI0035DEDA79
MTATIIAPLVASHQTHPSHCPASLGVIDDIEREVREADKPEPDETETAHFAQSLAQMLLATPTLPAAGPACCGDLMTETSPGCWRCQVCGLTLTPFRLTANPSLNGQYTCCGRPMEWRGNGWHCNICSGWTADFPTGSTLPPTPGNPPRQPRSQADEGLRRVRTPRATAGTGTLNTLAVLTAPLAASAAGTYQCGSCRGWFHSDKPFQLCTGCGGG